MNGYNKQERKIKHFKRIYIPLLERGIKKAEQKINGCLIENDYETAQNVFDEVNSYFKTLTEDMRGKIYPHHLKNKISELEEIIKLLNVTVT